jgi:hypothetical protein
LRLFHDEQVLFANERHGRNLRDRDITLDWRAREIPLNAESSPVCTVDADSLGKARTWRSRLSCYIFHIDKLRFN